MQTVKERIRQRRAQMLIHSYLYYVLDQPIISDHQWQQWADELVELQLSNKVQIGFYDAEFCDWNGSTGMHLPKDKYVVSVATRVLKHHQLLRKE